MTNSPSATRRQPFDFSTRLILTYIFAGVAFAAAESSLYVLGVAFIGWVASTIWLVVRFKSLALWALLGAPFAFYWLYVLTSGPRSDLILV